jgi:hypothetical protein
MAFALSSAFNAQLCPLRPSQDSQGKRAGGQRWLKAELTDKQFGKNNRARRSIIKLQEEKIIQNTNILYQSKRI